MFGSCLSSRLLLGAMGGYVVGSLSHSATWAWVGAALGALAVWLWSRRRRARTGSWCATGCAVPVRGEPDTVVEARSAEGSASGPGPAETSLEPAAGPVGEPAGR